jgi:ELWxxDGT repeat protein
MKTSFLRSLQDQIRALTSSRSAQRRRRLKTVSTEQLETRLVLSAVVDLVADINQAPGGIEQFRGDAQVEINGVTFFTADTREFGNELWRTDGTGAGTYRLTEIAPGPQDSEIYSMTRIGNQILFLGGHQTVRDTLWRSDGTVAGTQMVFNAAPGHGFSIPQITSFGDYAVYSTDGSSAELWRTDGTATGTARYFTLPNGERLDKISAVSGGHFFFSSYHFDRDSATNIWSIWLSDGSAAGTLQLRTLDTGLSLSSREFTTANGRVFMLVSDELFNHSIWTSDGTAAGTLPIDELSGDSIPLSASQLTVVGDNLFFVGSSAAPGRGLWAYNITDHSATSLTGEPDVIDYWYSSASVEFAGALYFDHSGELWKSDGTREGTRSISAPEGVYFHNLTVVKNSLLLTGRDFEHGAELWTSDGTSDGTYLLKDILSGAGSSLDLSTPSSMPPAHNAPYAVFTANDGIHGTELWGTDGTSSGTQMLAELVTATGNSNPNHIIASHGELLFLAGGLWSTDSGAHTIVDQGFASDIINQDGNIYYYSVSEDGNRMVPFLWDGVQGQLVPGVPTELDIASAPIKLGGSEYFFGFVYDQPLGFRSQLRKSIDGGTDSALVMEFPYILTQPYFAYQDLLYVLVPNGSGLFDLWRSNGSTEGTFIISQSPVYATTAAYRQFVSYHNNVLFAHPNGIYVTDGSAAGTYNVENFVAELDYLAPIGALRESYLAYGNSVEAGSSIWKTNGTPDGTVLVKSGIAWDFGMSVANDGHAYFFGYSDATEGRTSLWKSDGTDSGTTIIYTFEKGYSRAEITNLRIVGNKLIFTVLDSTTGQPSIWLSDGTKEGTLPLRHNYGSDLVFDTEAQFTLYNDGIAFRANTSNAGTELFRIDTTIAVSPPSEITFLGWAAIERVINVRGVDLAWADISGAIQYDVWIQNLTHPSMPPVRKRVNEPRFNVFRDDVIDDNLNPGDAYRVWVRSLPVLGNPSAWSAAKDFTLGPDPVMHSIQAFNVNAKPVFNWAGPTDAVSYEIWLTNRDTKTRTLYEKNLTSTTFAVTESLAPAKYAVWVRGTRSDGSLTAWSTVNEFVVLTPPVTLTAGVGDQRSPRPTFVWSGVNGATGYDVRVFLPDGKTLVYSADSVTGVSHTPTQDLPACKFVVNVRALKNSQPLSAWSAGDALWMKLPPKNLRTTATGFAWDAVPFAGSYTFELRGTSGALYLPRKTQTGTTIELTTPLPPGRYTLRVFASYPKASSNWTETFSTEVFRSPVTITSSTAPTVDATPTISWTAATGASSYEVLVTKPGSSVPIYTRTGITSTSHRIDVPLANGISQFQVRAIFPDGSRSSLSDVQSLTIGIGTPVTFSAGSLSWNSVNGATNYELWINYLGTPNRRQVVYDPMYLTTSYKLPSTLPKGRYQTWLRPVRAESGQLYYGAWTSVLFDIM